MTATVTDPVRHWIELSALEHLITVVVGEAYGENFQSVQLDNGFNLLPGGLRPSFHDVFKEAIPDERDGAGDPEVDLRQVQEMLFSARLLQSLTPAILDAESDRLVALAEEHLAKIARNVEGGRDA